MKKYLPYVLYVIFVATIGSWWFMVYHHEISYEMTVINDNDTTSFVIISRHTKQVLIDEKDTAYMFFDEHGNNIITIKKNELNNVKFKKIE